MSEIIPRDDLWVWVDLEMTGLDPATDVILEIAMLITDADLRVIATGPELVIHQPERYLQNLDPWVQRTHSASGLLDSVRHSTCDLTQACSTALAFLQRYTQKNSAPLCGNSIGTDRAFLQQGMPEVFQHVHYRSIDVSSLKILYQTWTKGGERPPEKKSHHRALDDIKESVAELAFYRKVMFANAY